MNEELLALQTRVNGVIYNPFINLKDQIKDAKKLLSQNEAYASLIIKLDSALTALDEFESLPHGNLERIKGFNKTKSSVLRVFKEVLAAKN